MLNRRKILQGIAAGAGFGLSTIPHSLLASAVNATPKRVVFFLQNQGFDPKTCIPRGMPHSGPLDNATLPEPISALEPYKDKLHIINGLHGRHTSPSHSAFFGALGGYRGSDGVPPNGSTIDYELSKILPQTLMPHLCIGMDSLDNMIAKPTIATLSASDAGKPIFMHSNPNHLYELLFGGISEGNIRRQHDARTELMNEIESIADFKGQSLPVEEKLRYQQFVEGFQNINALRDRLDRASNHVRRFAPKVDALYAKPEFETDWHDRLLNLGIAALTSGITNTLTIGSGRGEIYGSWKGLGIETQGHNLGHMVQHNNPIWTSIRQYNCEMLVKLVDALENVPEGSGTMMDHTLIVYTSNNADKQHTGGANWPVMLLGDLGGAIKTGRFTQLDGKRPINALYTSILRAAGKNVDQFNMSQKLALKYDRGSGPLGEVLA